MLLSVYKNSLRQHTAKGGCYYSRRLLISQQAVYVNNDCQRDLKSQKKEFREFHQVVLMTCAAGSGRMLRLLILSTFFCVPFFTALLKRCQIVYI